MQNKSLDERYGWRFSPELSGVEETSTGEFSYELFLETVRQEIKLSRWRTFDGFALAHGYSHSNFSAKLNGKVEFAISDIICLCTELGLPLDLSCYMR